MWQWIHIRHSHLIESYLVVYTYPNRSITLNYWTIGAAQQENCTGSMTPSFSKCSSLVSTFLLEHIVLNVLCKILVVFWSYMKYCCCTLNKSKFILEQVLVPIQNPFNLEYFLGF